MSVVDVLRSIGPADIVDIGLVTVVLYWVAHAFRGTRTAFVLIGIVVVGAFLLTARVAGLRLIAFLFEAFFTVILLVLVVIFQEELRRLFERVGLGSLRRRRRRKEAETFSSEVEALATTAVDLAREKIGALIVLEGADVLAHHVHGGIRLDGRVSIPVLKSLFDPHSIGHDGAVIVSGDRITQFCCHLPLSTDVEQLAGRGTRHAAALGLADRTDALCLVVSEERGSIAAARGGRLTPVGDVAQLTKLLEAFFRQRNPARKATSWATLLRRNPLLKLGTACIAILLWFFFVHESKTEFRSLTVPIRHAPLASGLVVQAVQPERVQVLVSAPRRNLYFLDADQIDLTVKLFEELKGMHEVNLSPSDLTLPQGISFVNIAPRKARLTIGECQPAAPARP